MKMTTAQPILKVLGICGSLKKTSVNMSALNVMMEIAPTVGIEMTIADLSSIPFFNPDNEQDGTKSDAVQTLLRQMKAADAFVLATPEYNYSYGPALKNALDWGSRYPGNELFKGKATSIISAGGGMKGSRAQYHLRQVAVFLDLYVLNKPEIMMSAFDGTFDKTTGELVSVEWQDRLKTNLEALKEFSFKLNPPPFEDDGDKQL